MFKENNQKNRKHLNWIYLIYIYISDPTFWESEMGKHNQQNSSCPSWAVLSFTIGGNAFPLQLTISCPTSLSLCPFTFRAKGGCSQNTSMSWPKHSQDISKMLYSWEVGCNQDAPERHQHFHSNKLHKLGNKLWIYKLLEVYPQISWQQIHYNCNYI